MKTTLFILAVVLAGIVIGCQEAQITNPAAGSDEAMQPVLKSVVPTIALSGILHEPGPAPNLFTEIRGQLRYSLAVVPLDPIPPNPQFLATLDMTTSAELRRSRSPIQSLEEPWRVSGTSQDNIPLFENGEGFLDKSYSLEGRTDGVRLHVRLHITLTRVTLAGIWLEAPRGPVGADTH